MRANPSFEGRETNPVCRGAALVSRDTPGAFVLPYSLLRIELWLRKSDALSSEQTGIH